MYGYTCIVICSAAKQFQDDISGVWKKKRIALFYCKGIIAWPILYNHHHYLSCMHNQGSIHSFTDKKKRSLYCKILKDVLPNIYFNFSVYILLRRAGISVKRLVHKHSVLNMDFTGMTHTNNIESLILIYV